MKEWIAINHNIFFLENEEGKLKAKAEVEFFFQSIKPSLNEEGILTPMPKIKSVKIAAFSEELRSFAKCLEIIAKKLDKKNKE